MFKKLINFSVKLVQKFLPDPFVFAILLTLIAGVSSYFITGQSVIQIVRDWGNGLWGLLGFAMQMSLILICGSTYICFITLIAIISFNHILFYGLIVPIR